MTPPTLWQLVVVFSVLNHVTRGNQVLNMDEEVSPTDIKELDRASLSFPGTKWCGPGNTASGFDDLGKFKETDMCCRAHDNCDNIPSGETNHGLMNNNPFTVLNCDCDKAFYNCLRSSKDDAAPLIGEKYFLLQSRCYREDYPIKGCAEYDRRCIKYELDSSQPKKYQWFNLPFYSMHAFPDDSFHLRIEGNAIDGSIDIED